MLNNSYLFACSHMVSSVTWYATERGKRISIPLPSFYLNQQALRLTVKMIWERMPSYLHSVTWSLLNWLGGGSKKSRMISPQTLHVKMPLLDREIWRRIFSFWREVSERNTLISADSARSLTRKKQRKEFEHWNSPNISTT